VGYDATQDLSWFSLTRQPQEPLAPGGVTLESEDLAEWVEQFRPFLKYLRRKEVILALSGGGMSMPCHVSALRVLELLSVPISRIYGTSAGAVIGGLFAAGLSTSELERVMLDIGSPDELFGFASRLPTLRFMTGAVVRTLTKPSFETSGLYSLTKVEDYVERLLIRYVGRVPRMGELKLPVTCVAFDIGTGRPSSSRPESARKTIFSRDATPDVRLSEAIGASMSIPGALTPKKIGERYYIDGSAVEHLPIATAFEEWLERKSFRSRQVTIAVDLGYGGEAPHEDTLCTPTDLMMYSNNVRERALTQFNMLRCHRPRRGSSVVLVRPSTFPVGL